MPRSGRSATEDRRAARDSPSPVPGTGCTSAATVLAFLQKERGLLQPGFKFQPLIQETVVSARVADASTGSANGPVGLTNSSVQMEARTGADHDSEPSRR